MTEKDDLKAEDSQTVLNKIVQDYLREKKRKRIFRFITRGIILIAVIWVAIQMLTFKQDGIANTRKPHVGLIDIDGDIFDKDAANSDDFAKGLEKAYASSGLKALIMRINSPGGSPVQADYMYNAINFYKKKYPDIKVYAVCVDSCASAAYYIASAADEIYANQSSIVGSIGVLYNGFGFVDTIHKLGVTRRLQTAGKNKAFLDPFSPESEKQKETLQKMLNIIHEQFIKNVKAGRGSRLKVDDETFSGLFWTGIQAKERGLIDGFASSGQVARNVVKLDTIIDYTETGSVLDRVAKHLGATMAHHLPHALGISPGIS